MAKKTLMSYREWKQREKEQKARAAERRAAAKEAKMAAWWAIPAQSNYVELSAWWVDRHGIRPGTVYGYTGQPIGPDGICVTGRVLPDKRRGPHGAKLSVSLTVPGDADREAIARHLIELASVLLTSEEPWRTATGAPLARPVRIEGIPIQIVPERPWSHTHASPAPTVDPQPAHAASPFQDLLTLRARLQRWLSAHRTDESPLVLLTVEQLAEVLLMRVCGDDIALVSERDPWRWDHTPEELQAVESALADEMQTLSALVVDLSRRLGAAEAIAVLLTVFVEGRSV